MFRSATLSGVVVPRAFQPQANFLAGGRARRLIEVDRAYSDSSVVWQEAVYVFARELAEATDHVRIVDIGTGTGIKLHTAFAGYAAGRLQVDWRDQRNPLPEGEAQGAFLSANLEDFTDLAALEGALDPAEPTLFILADVIEHLADPRPVLRFLRRLLKRHASNRLVISTPDRHRVDGAGSEGLPDNRGHVRQWTLNEFGLAMMATGFQVRRIGRLPQNQFDQHERGTVAELSCSVDFHRQWLSEHGFPPPSDHLIITTEHARAERTGGIGTYTQLAEEADDRGRVILFAGAMGLPEEGWWNACREKGWIHVSDICGRSASALQQVAQLDPEEILQAVLQTLFLYDDVRLIEYQDYLGIGLRVAQAKRAGLIPPSVALFAYAHGNHLYLDAAGGDIAGDRPPRLDASERLSLELADYAVFPSRYIRELYVEKAGFRPRAERHLPYPIRVEETGLDDLSRGPISKLVFYGKQSPQKGYPDFVDAVLALFTTPAYAAAAGRIKQVVLMGVTDPDPRLSNISAEITYGIWSRVDVVAMLRRFSVDALVVLPYRGDNYPLSTFEVVDSDCQLLGFDIGGVAEQIPSRLSEQLLCAPNASALAAAIVRALAMSHWDRCELVRQTRRLFCARYEDHIRQYRDAIEEMKRGDPIPARPRDLGKVTVIVPNLNGPRGYLDDVATGLRHSFHRPAHVIFVDDGSSEGNIAVLEDVAATALGDIPTEIVRNASNVGLAAARNVGLERVMTPYVCAHDNDNVVLNRFLQIACRILDANPGVAAVTTWTRYFEDGTSWEEETWGAGYRPIGADLGLALRVNTIGDALAVYRVDAVRAIGGWDGSSKAKWEDWQLLARLVSIGQDIWVIPREMTLYRVRADSMLRTYSVFPAWLRLASALPGLPREQAVSLLRSLWTPTDTVADDLAPVMARGTCEEIRREKEWFEKEMNIAQAWGRDLQDRFDSLWRQVTERRNIDGGDASVFLAGEADLAEFDRIRTMIAERRRSQEGLPGLPPEIGREEVARLRAIEASTTWRATRHLRLLLEAHPTLKRGLRGMLSTGFRSARKVRGTLRRR